MDYTNFDIIDYHLSHNNYTHEELYGSYEDLNLTAEILDTDSVFSKYYNKLCKYQQSILFPDIYKSIENNNIEQDKNIERNENCKCIECIRDLENECYNNYESDIEFNEEDYDY
tara:strand:- start:20 stop:361 length:342 start_codon:yes stop_codon:yes gene_type:complete